MDGFIAPPLTVFDVLQGRAAMKQNTAGGFDGCPPEVYREIPFVLGNIFFHKFDFQDFQTSGRFLAPSSSRLDCCASS